MNYTCPTCNTELEPVQDGDEYRVFCNSCNYSQRFTECPECEENSFSIHPRQKVAAGLKGKCVTCGHHENGGVSIFNVSG